MRVSCCLSVALVAFLVLPIPSVAGGESEDYYDTQGGRDLAQCEGTRKDLKNVIRQAQKNIPDRNVHRKGCRNAGRIIKSYQKSKASKKELKAWDGTDPDDLDTVEDLCMALLGNAGEFLRLYERSQSSRRLLEEQADKAVSRNLVSNFIGELIDAAFCAAATIALGPACIASGAIEIGIGCIFAIRNFLDSCVLD